MTQLESLDFYIEGVLSGTIPTGKLVRQAVQRHVDDLRTGSVRGLYFDLDAVNRVLKFYGLLTHYKGEWANSAFTLSPWQVFIVASLYGWKRADGTRRFRTAYIEVPRKNGKTTLASGFGLYGLIGDQEPGAEVYSAATKRDQAKLLFDDAKAMVLASPYLSKHVTCSRLNLAFLRMNSKFEPLSADSKKMDGLRPSTVLIDELHAHKDRGVYDLLKTGQGSRRQPLLVAITTAGIDRYGVGYQQRTYGVQILDEVVADDSYFAFIATIDAEDDWRDPASWAKANPNLGISKKLDYLAQECKEAQEVPGQQNSFKRFHLDIWTESVSVWLERGKWAACAAEFDEASLLGRPCYGGLDLSTTTDLAAFVLVFPDDQNKILPYFWVPEETIEQRSRTDRVPYDLWVKEGLIRKTPGASVEYQVIRQHINELGDKFAFREIAADPWNATQLLQELAGDGFTVVQIRQGFASLTAPSKALASWVADRKFSHPGHPVLDWCAANTSIEEDAAGNIKPSKAKSTERIDGIAALVTAMARSTLHKPKPKLQIAWS